jgi:hypothetical protein
MIRGFVKGQNELITRQKYTSVGPDSFSLIAYRDPSMFLARDFEIHTQPTGGVKLKNGYDYIFASNDVIYSEKDFVGEKVISKLRVINETYQDTDLYITYRWVADYASDEMMNRFDRALDQMINSIVTAEDSSVVVSNAGNVVAQGEEYPGYREEL